ncbi:MAG: hypothetical protein WCA37_01035 [Terracidiphilus sp.]
MLRDFTKWIWTQRWRALSVLVALLVLAEVAGLQSLRDRVAGMRSPNRYDLFHAYMAQELNAPSLCRMIPWSVRVGPGIDDAASYARSDCYETVAGNTGNPWLCWQVKRLGAVSLRHQTSVWSCVARARRHEQGGMALAPEELVEFFRLMGYVPDTLQLEGVTPALVQVKAIYRGLTDRIGVKTGGSAGRDEVAVVPGSVGQGLLLRRIAGLIGDVDVPLARRAGDALHGAYLADMAAMASQDWRWCMKIPMEIQLHGERSGFRDRCLLKVATETRDAGVCAHLSPAANKAAPDPSGRPRGESLAADCRLQASSRLPAVTHYGPEVPADDAQTRALLEALKVEIPRATDLPQEQIYDAYMQFLHELNGRKQDAAHVAARRRLIAHVEALPAQ